MPRRHLLDQKSFFSRDADLARLQLGQNVGHLLEVASADRFGFCAGMPTPSFLASKISVWPPGEFAFLLQLDHVVGRDVDALHRRSRMTDLPAVRNALRVLVDVHPTIHAPFATRLGLVDRADTNAAGGNEDHLDAAVIHLASCWPAATSWKVLGRSRFPASCRSWCRGSCWRTPRLAGSPS